MKPIIELLVEYNEFIKENPCEYGLELTVREVKIIAEALEKQIPKNPKEDRCPSCSTEVRIFHDIGNPDDCNFWEQTYDFCPDCGQAIEWGDE